MSLSRRLFFERRNISRRDREIAPYPATRRVPALTGVFEDGLGGAADAGHEFARLENFGMSAPAKDPALNFAEAGKFQMEFDAAFGKFFELLRRVPFLFADVISGEFIEANRDFEFALAGMDAEAVAQAFLERKSFGASELFPGEFDGLDTRGRKGANVVSQMVEGEEEPFAIDVGQVIWINHTRFGLLLAGFALGQFDMLALGGGFGELVKDFEMDDRLRAGAKGNGLFPIGNMDGNGVGYS